MPSAEIITIGTELLLGEIQDTNTSYIAKTLKSSGIDIFHASIIGDNKERISREIRSALERADIVITTGGLGPTVDDPTRDAVALAFNINTEFHQELWEQIQSRFKAYGRTPTENNKRQAYLPMGAIPIPNPVGTAPAFFINTNNKYLFSLPGVPSEMKTLLHSDVLPIIKRGFNFESVIITRIIHTAGIGESSVDELISDLELMSNPTVGLAAHPGQVDIRIAAKAKNPDEAQKIIEPVESKIIKLLGKHIYGTDVITLEHVVYKLLTEYKIKLYLNFEPDFLDIAELLSGWLKIPASSMRFGDKNQIYSVKSPLYNQEDRDLMILDLKNETEGEKSLTAAISYLGQLVDRKFNFGGHPLHFNQWAGNQILNFMRESIMSFEGEK